MENERDNKPIPAQWLHLLNSSHIQRKIEGSAKLGALLGSGRSSTMLIEELYLTVLSRLPSAEEMKLADSLGQLQPARATKAGANTKTPPPAKGASATKAGAAAKTPPPAPAMVLVKRREDWIDLTWSLINSTEFLYHH
jgi:hypothetical protein